MDDAKQKALEAAVWKVGDAADFLEMSDEERTLLDARQKTKTLPYDVAEQLRTPEERAAYLDAWFAEAPEDAAGVVRALGEVARAAGMSQVARDAGLSRESLDEALGPNGNPSFATVLKVAAALGLRLHATPLPEAPKSN